MIYNPQTRPPKTQADKEISSGNATDIHIDLDDYLLTPAPAEPDPPRPLIPSRPSDPEPAIESPLQNENPDRFKRGNLTHMLLQLLPDVTEKDRQHAAANFLAKPVHALPEAIQNEMVRDIMNILTNPDYAPFFGPGSRAEVPITGLINGKLVSGQIDRLLVTEDTVWIIDYKTGRTPPQTQNEMPPAYKAQMQAYHDTLKDIYPDKPIKCALLWTTGPVFMRLDL
jgi:ATP-dependent helicase/nuclease subunit A